MNLKPVKSLSEDQLESGLKLVVADGLSAEAMVVFSVRCFGGTANIHHYFPAIFYLACSKI
jgi:hypothetical protein